MINLKSKRRCKCKTEFKKYIKKKQHHMIEPNLKLPIKYSFQDFVSVSKKGTILQLESKLGSRLFDIGKSVAKLNQLKT